MNLISVRSADILVCRFAGIPAGSASAHFATRKPLKVRRLKICDTAGLKACAT
jgi:hypothetical protein